MRPGLEKFLDGLLTLILLFALVQVGTARGEEARGFFDGAKGYTLCTVADLASTVAAVENGAVEANPIYGDSFERHDYLVPLAINGLIVGLAWAYEDHVPKWVFNVGSGFRCGAAAWNLQFLE